MNSEPHHHHFEDGKCRCGAVWDRDPPLPPCNIPSMLVGRCDLEWGHEGDMHANAGDGFYARGFEHVHRRRQELVQQRQAARKGRA